jgi:septal ring factor EnvC (AmiA/AmiB activator)
LFASNFNFSTISADEIEDIQKEINKLSEAKKLSQSATKPLEGQLENLQKQLIQIQYNIEALSQKIIKKEKDLNARTQKIAEQQALLEVRVRSYYIRSFLNSPLAVIFSQDSAGRESVFIFIPRIHMEPLPQDPVKTAQPQEKAGQGQASGSQETKVTSESGKQ